MRSLSNDVICWGNNNSGQTDAPAIEAIQLDLRSSHSCALKEDGTLICWGTAAEDLSLPKNKFLEIAIGNQSGCGVSESGETQCWGSPLDGRTTPPLK